MPVIADTSQEASLRLHRAAEPLNPPDDRIVIQTGWPQAAGFAVSQALYDAYQADLANPDPPLPNCRSGNPCYQAACAENVITQPPTLSALAPNTAAVGAPNTTVTLTGTNFVAPMTANIDPPGADVTLTGVPVTVTSPTSATVVVPASALDTAGNVIVRGVTQWGTTGQQQIVVA